MGRKKKGREKGREENGGEGKVGRGRNSPFPVTATALHILLIFSDVFCFLPPCFLQHAILSKSLSSYKCDIAVSA